MKLAECAGDHGFVAVVAGFAAWLLGGPGSGQAVDHTAP